jgi:hypothetical protein
MPYLEISGEYLAGSLLLKAWKGQHSVGGKMTTSSPAFCKEHERVKHKLCYVIIFLRL